MKCTRRRSSKIASVIQEGFVVFTLFLSGVQALSPSQASVGLNVINGENPQKAPAAGEWHLYASVALK